MQAYKEKKKRQQRDVIFGVTVGNSTDDQIS